MGMPPMGGDPMMGGDASSMPGGDPNVMGGDPGMDPMGGDDMMGNDPQMGSEPFGDTDGDAEMSSDPEKKIESLAGQIASIMRKDLSGDGIDKHEDKKKEVLGMVASAVIDGMDDEQRQGIIDYLSDKLNGEGESDGDTDGGSEDDSIDTDDSSDNGEMNDMQGNDNGMPQMDTGMEGQSAQQMMESIVHKIVREMTINQNNKIDKKSVSKVEEPETYKTSAYTSRK